MDNYRQDQGLIWNMDCELIIEEDYGRVSRSSAKWQWKKKLSWRMRARVTGAAIGVDDGIRRGSRFTTFDIGRHLLRVFADVGWRGSSAVRVRL